MTAARCPTNELHTSLNELHTSLNDLHRSLNELHTSLMLHTSQWATYIPVIIFILFFYNFLSQNHIMEIPVSPLLGFYSIL